MPCYLQGGGLCLLFCVILCKRRARQVYQVAPRQHEGLAVVTYDHRSSQWLGHHHGVRVMLTICGADATVQGQGLFFMYGANHRPFLGDARRTGAGWLFRARHAFCVRPTPAALPFGIPPAVKLLATAKVLKTHLEAIGLAQQIGLVLVHRLALKWLACKVWRIAHAVRPVFSQARKHTRQDLLTRSCTTSQTA